MAETVERSDYPEIREAVVRLCAQFPGEYWRELDRENRYPSEFVNALTEAGYLSVLIPEEYGGSTSSGSSARRGSTRWRRSRRTALRLDEAGQNPGAEANMAKMLAADASFEAANVCVQTHGGFGFAEEYASSSP